MKKLLKAALPVAIALSLAACVSDSKDDTDAVELSETVSMTLESKNLEDLGTEFDYEGWIIVDGSAVSTGKFDIVNGVTEPSSFTLNRDQASAATKFVLTIEPAQNDPAAPAETHILAGPIANGISTIVTNHPDAFGSDFTESAGTFILATPSNGNATPTQGIWYLDNSSEAFVLAGAPLAALTLPELPAGWAYEGWVVGEDGPISTGTFTSVTGEDSDGAGPTAGPSPTPAFPGQDFITPALDLVDLTSVISVEPVPDNSEAPFSMKPLVSVIAASDNVLGNVAAASLPSGTVTINF